MKAIVAGEKRIFRTDGLPDLGGFFFNILTDINMSKLKLPVGYQPALDVLNTEKAIKKLKDYFEVAMADELCLQRVTAPLMVFPGTGINDDLSGSEPPVSFDLKGMHGRRVEVVQSLAKWKRLKLAALQLEPGRGIYTDMNALRPNEELTNLHSIYVDQWDWELTIRPADRNLEFLKRTVKKIFRVFKRAEEHIAKEFPALKKRLPDYITFIHAEELRAMYPDMLPREREDRIAQKHRAVFIIGVGGRLADGSLHDERAADYDDWTTEATPGLPGLNGDILFWHPELEQAVEISSMGIRVSPEALLRQLEIRNEQFKKELLFHGALLAGKLPLCIGGGIGQSRTCMSLLQKAHIGEVQAGIWPEAMHQSCREAGIPLL